MRSPASAMSRYFSPPLDEVSGWAKDGVVCGRIQAWDTNTTKDLLRSGRSRYRTNALSCRCTGLSRRKREIRGKGAGWGGGGGEEEKKRGVP